MKIRLRLGAVAAAYTLLSSSGPARAQAPDPASLTTAQALFEAATRALDDRDYAAACPKLEEVVRLVPSGHGARLTLGECYEGAGKLASAWGQYSIVEASASEKDKRKIASAKVATLRPKLAQLTVTLPDSSRKLPGIEIRRDGQLLGAAQWGIAVPVDKGEHEIVANATGRSPWKKVVRIEADGQKLDVVIGPFENEPPRPDVSPKPQDASSGNQALSQLPTESPKPAFSRKRAQQIAAMSVGATGLAALAVGTGFGIAAIGRRNDAAGHCDSRNIVCDRIGFDAITEARTWGNVSTALVVVGSVAFATGVTLYLTMPKRTADQYTTMSIGPTWIGVRRDF